MARGYCLFKRPHHQRVSQILDCLNEALLARTECFFGGGTAIVLLLDEYRESVDIDLLCASHDGYRELRNTVSERSLGAVMKRPVELLREVRADRYGVRTFCKIDDTPVKLEIIREDRIKLSGQTVATLPIPTLSQADMYAEKLLANTDRWADRSTANRDAIDLAMMIHHWGPIPHTAWVKVREAYGASVDRALTQATALLADNAHLLACLKRMDMDVALAPTIQTALSKARSL
jgi:hypothetical protein